MLDTNSGLPRSKAASFDSDFMGGEARGSEVDAVAFLGPDQRLYLPNISSILHYLERLKTLRVVVLLNLLLSLTVITTGLPQSWSGDL